MSTVQNLQKFPSLGSIASTTTVLPPGFVAKRYKPSKPFGPSVLTLMNRTAIGPGRRFCRYGFICIGIAILFVAAGSTYLGLRNVSRMIVFRTEVLGPFCIGMFLLFLALAARMFYEARLQSNRWRAGIKFRPSGMNTIVAYNMDDPEDEIDKDLVSGTFTDRALKEIPRGRGALRGRSRFTSLASLRSARSMDNFTRGPLGKPPLMGMGHTGAIEPIPEKVPVIDEAEVQEVAPSPVPMGMRDSPVPIGGEPPLGPPMGGPPGAYKLGPPGGLPGPIPGPPRGPMPSFAHPSPFPGMARPPMGMPPPLRGLPPMVGPRPTRPGFEPAPYRRGPPPPGPFGPQAPFRPDLDSSYGRLPQQPMGPAPIRPVPQQGGFINLAARPPSDSEL